MPGLQHDKETTNLLRYYYAKTYFTWRVDNEDVNEELHAKSPPLGEPDERR